MNVKALLRADHWIGVPVCFLLTVATAIFRRHSPAHAAPPRNILFVKMAEQGSTVLAYPALKRAVALVGGENVYFISFQDNRFILDALRVIPEQNVFTVSVENVRKFLHSVCRALWRLRRLKVEVAIDMEFFSRGSAILAFLSGAKRRVGFHAFFGAGTYRGNLMTHRLIFNPHLHTSQTFLGLVEAVLCNPAALPTFSVSLPAELPEPPQFVPNLEEIERVREMLGWEACDRRPLVLLNPNSGDLLPLRRWPTNRYVELAGGLVERYPECRVVFTGAPSEAETAEQLVRDVASERCVSLAGKTTLRQLLVLYSMADLLVTNDSGPAHFATLTPVRVITLFGPETPQLFAARTARNTVLWAGLPCSPCVSAYNNRQSPCRDNQCMQAISVDEVFSAVCRALDPKPIPNPS